MSGEDRPRRRPASLAARVAALVSLTVFSIAVVLFFVGSMLSKSWTRSEQKSQILAIARDHVGLLETIAADSGPLDDALNSLHPVTRATIVLAERGIGVPLAETGTAATPEVLESVRNGAEVYVHDAGIASSSLVALPISVAGETGVFVEAIDHTPWDTRIERTRRALAATGILITLGGAIGGLIAGRRLSRPLSDAAAAARRLAEGGLEVRLPPTDDPALASLTETMNDMIETLATRVAADRRFNSDVSHELRSPLTTLNASIAVLQSRRNELSEPNKVALDLLAADLQRFTRLVDDLLEISRFDGGAAILVPSRVNISEFLDEVVRSVHADDVHLVVSPMLRVFELEIDKRRISRVITNLLDNALSHGKPPVWLTAVEIPPGSLSPTEVCITVEDRGTGVDLDRAEELFERFNRGARQGRAEGSGLGLALAREHVRLHGGTINFEPLPPQVSGTRLTVHLPVRAATTVERRD